MITAPCADDDAATVAIAVATAESLTAVLDRDLVVAIFDAEEPPYFMTERMGSIRFYSDNTDSSGFHVAMNMNLVGTMSASQVAYWRIGPE